MVLIIRLCGAGFVLKLRTEALTIRQLKFNPEQFADKQPSANTVLHRSDMKRFYKVILLCLGIPVCAVTFISCSLTLGYLSHMLGEAR